MLSFALPRFKRTVHLLFVCQALANTGMSLVTTTTALAALTIADDPALVTLPMALQYLSTMVFSSPASLLMRWLGRRAGFTVAAGIVISVWGAARFETSAGARRGWVGALDQGVRRAGRDRADWNILSGKWRGVRDFAHGLGRSRAAIERKRRARTPSGATPARTGGAYLSVAGWGVQGATTSHRRWSSCTLKQRIEVTNDFSTTRPATSKAACN
jgi:hypothetical protein